MLKPTYKLPPLPPTDNLETIPVLKALAAANRALGELKGRVSALPNPSILIETLGLQEARDSSEIENIVTTQDELFKADLFAAEIVSPAAKEVALYKETLKLGAIALANTGLITNGTMIAMFQKLKGREDGFRSTLGTALRNERTGETVYIPPQEINVIQDAMGELERFINDSSDCNLDPLIKMAIIHHQFESIHPFSDGNGRLGRMLNVLYLARSGLLEIPVLYFSRYVNSTKAEYYRLLQYVRETGNWESWILYNLIGVEQTSNSTLELVEGLRSQMADMKKNMRKRLPKIYSQDLLNNLFRHPYTKIEYVQSDLGVTRQTASKYLETLNQSDFVHKIIAGRSNYYVNLELVSLLIRVSGRNETMPTNLQ